MEMEKGGGLLAAEQTVYILHTMTNLSSDELECDTKKRKEKKKTLRRLEQLRRKRRGTNRNRVLPSNWTSRNSVNSLGNVNLEAKHTKERKKNWADPSLGYDLTSFDITS